MRTRLTAIFLFLCLICLSACKGDPIPTEPEKITLRIGVLESPYQFYTRPTETLEQLVRSYNIVSESKGWNVEVVIDSYGTQGDRDAMLTLNSTLSSKTSAPDLLMVEGMPWQNYGERGLLVDLYGRMEPEGGEGLSRDDFFQGPLHALEYDGKLYCLPASFISEFTYGTGEYFSAPGPVDEDTLFGVWRENAADTVLLTGGYGRSTAFSALALSAVCSRYIDQANKTCDFTDPDFSHLLELFCALPDNDVVTLHNGQSIGADMWEGRALVNMSPMQSYWNYLIYSTYFPDAVPISLPGSDGLSAYCQYTIPLAITVSSAHQDTAWSFIEYCLHYINHGIPMRKAEFDRQIEQEGFYELWSFYENSEDPDLSKLSLTLPSLITGNMEQTAPYTREAHEAFRAMLDQPVCSRFGSGNFTFYQPTELENIILAEVELYFNDKCTLEQCVAVIQERVELYLAEQG